METKKVTKEKNASNYCEYCDYTTSHKGSFTKHLSTKKHIFSEFGDKNGTKTHQLICSLCDKQFNSRNGLWKHKKICGISENKLADKNKDNIIEILLKENTDFKNIMLDVVKSNTHLQQHCSDLQKQFNEVCKNTNSHNKTYINNTNNSHNKTFNLQFFLNEQCKDAVNLSDFVKSITLQLSDLENVGKLGYVEGISNIMIKKLNEMDIYKRPVHCSDAKRETLYVKDEDCWEKEPENNPRLRKAIRHISKKNSDLLTAWSDKNPASKNNQSKENNKYMVMIQQAMGGSGEIADNENKIIKKLAKVFLIEKNQ